jgi:hypothetical protein
MVGMEVIAFGFSLISVILTVIKVLNNSNFHVKCTMHSMHLFIIAGGKSGKPLRDLQRTIKSPSCSKQDKGKSKLQRIKKN